MDTFLLPLLLLVPAVGGIAGMFMPSGKAAKNWALFVSLLTALVTLGLVIQFPWGVPGSWLNWGGGPDSAMQVKQIGFHFHLGIDAISLWLVILTSFLMPLGIAASYDAIQERQKEYYGWMLALMFAMLGVFLARDMLLFYVFFELTLIPMFFIIGVWGGPERHYAAAKFFLYTFAGGVFTLAAIVYLGLHAGTFDMETIIRYAQNHLDSATRWWIVLALLIGFAIKVPLFPVHTWLPLAHTEAPTAGSVILAGVLLKLGTYGILRLALPIGLLYSGGLAFPILIKAIGVICVIGVIYGALAAWVQPDIKKLVAYSSVSHLGFCVLGIVALNEIGLKGSVLYMINHGLSTGAMFLVIGMIYERYHTRDIHKLSGLARVMPKLAFFFVFFTLSSIGLPGLNGYVSEFLTILSAFTSTHLGSVWFGVFAAVGIILGALYMLHMVARVIFGPLKVPAVEHAGGEDESGHSAAGGDAHDGRPVQNDINGRELGILVPLALAVLLLGVLPNSVLDSLTLPVQRSLRVLVDAENPKPAPMRAIEPAPPTALAEAR